MVKRIANGAWQGSLPFTKHGGVRRGAGRKKCRDSGVSHCTRARLAPSYPVHVTVRLRAGRASLRQAEEIPSSLGTERISWISCMRAATPTASYSNRSQST